MSATEVLTAVLVLVTGFYAWQNRRMAQEMAAARRVAVMPKLALEWTMVSPVLGFPTVKNVGPGPALDVDISVHFEPLSEQNDEDVRRWTASVIVPGEEKQFLPTGGEGGGMMDTEALARTYSRIRLRGSYRDALGEAQIADDVLADIAEWRQISKEAHGRWEEPDPAKRLSRDLADRLGKKTLVPALEAIENRLEGR
jgi:hypothetical protein